MKSYLPNYFLKLFCAGFISFVTLTAMQTPYNDFKGKELEAVELVKDIVILTQAQQNESLINWYSANHNNPFACSLTYLYLENNLPKSIFKKFLSYGREFWAAKTPNGYTPLMMAVYAGDHELTELILNELNIEDILAKNVQGKSVQDYIENNPIRAHHIIKTRIENLLRNKFCLALVEAAYINGVFDFKKSLLGSTVFCADTKIGITDNEYVMDIIGIAQQIQNKDEIIETIRNVVNQKIHQSHYFVPLKTFLERSFYYATFELQDYDCIQTIDSRSIINAASYGDLQAVMNFINAGHDVNATDYYGNTALYFACANGHISVVKALLAVDSIDVNKANDCKETPLIGLISYGICGSGYKVESCTEIMHQLLKHPKIDINKKGYAGQTPLMIALSSTYSRESAIAIKLLLNDPRTDFSLTDDSGNTALITAAYHTGWAIGENGEYFKQIVEHSDKHSVTVALDIVNSTRLDCLINPLNKKLKTF